MSESRRPIGSLESLRSTRRSLGDGTVVGRSRSATPPKGALRTGVTAVGPEAPVVGETIALYRLSQQFDGGGTFIDWIGLYPQLTSGGFLDTRLPTTQVLIPRFAYYRLDLAFEWLTWRRGGRVQVFINGTVAWDVQAPYGARFDRTFDLGVLDVDDVIEVAISPIGDTVVDGFAAADGQTAINITGSFVLVDIPKNLVLPDPPVQVCGTYTGDGANCGTEVLVDQTMNLSSLDVNPGDFLFITTQASAIPGTSICCSGASPVTPGRIIMPEATEIRQSYRGAGVLGTDQSCVGSLVTCWYKIADGDEPDNGIDFQHNGEGTHGPGRWCVFNFRDRYRDVYGSAAAGNMVSSSQTVQMPFLEGGTILLVQRAPNNTGATGGSPAIQGEPVELLATGTWVDVYACGPGAGFSEIDRRVRFTRIRAS